jgi:hypothetical protein
MVGREGRYAEQRSVARAGSLFRSLVGPHGSPPAYYQRAVGDYTKPTTEATIMAINATSTGAIRPNSNGSDIRWISQATIIKRIRRKLAERGHYLQITREGSDARRELGEFCVLDDRFIPLSTNCKLAELAKFLGVLAAGEAIDPPSDKGWRHYVARQVTVEVNGKPCLYNEPVTRTYTTPEAARRAAAGIKDREGLVLCGFDASLVKGGTKNADH